ncbi:sigma-70 family RNA polymerase sigma factor [Streptomyces sp. NPDC050804]|uniref:sigma-70 family RNA polymerase sigma factor n=1 Tax=Streptomyces sp. NPDC050804 TaxID=3154745 RepID=UPI0034343C42
MPPSITPTQGEPELPATLRGSPSTGNDAEAPLQGRESATPADEMDETQLIDIVEWALGNRSQIDRWARRWEAIPEEAVQLGQEILTKILRSGAGKKATYPSAYVRRIAWGVACDHYERKAKSLQSVALSAEHEEIPNRVSGESVYGLRSVMRSAISQLPRRQKQVIWLRYYEGCLWADVASELGISVGVAKRYHLRALGNLRKGLSAVGVTKEDWRDQLAP